MSETTQETAPTPGPWRTWDAFTENGHDHYPSANKGDLRILGDNGICIGVVWGGMDYVPECAANAAHIVKCVNAYPDLVAERDARQAELQKMRAHLRARWQYEERLEARDSRGSVRDHERGIATGIIAAMSMLDDVIAGVPLPPAPDDAALRTGGK